MTGKAWVKDTYTVEVVDYDHELKRFEVTQNGKVQIITPDSIENMNQIIEDLDSGEDVDGWEDGHGNTIVID